MRVEAGTRTGDERTTLAGLLPAWWRAALAAGLIGLGAAAWLGYARADGWQSLLRAYLTSYCFYLSLSLGALFFVAVQHVTRAGWSVTVRRLAELLAANMAVLVVLFLPILVAVLAGNGSLYAWTGADAVDHSELLQHKRPYLNEAFFTVRVVVYFAVWWLLGRFFLRRSLEQDASGDPALTRRMERASPLALILYAFTVTFAAFDWLMSLEPAWFSTVFGVYFFSGAAVAFFAAIILLAVLLQACGRLTRSITLEHYHDLGKLLFAFVVFWGYIAFSQYMLIWYANIPEETTWYLARQTGSWKWVSLVLLFGHLLIPFFGLLPRGVKRSKPLLAFWAAWLLVMHYIDVYWLVMPSLEPAGPHFGLIDVACWLGVGGLYLAGALRVAGQRSLVPLRDPRLGEALAFENI